MNTQSNKTRELVKGFKGGRLNGTVQSGGALFFNPFIPDNELVKMKYNPTVRTITYENVNAPSNNFTDEQRRDIDAFVNFMLPFIVNQKTKEIAGPDIIKGLEVLSAGTFGITIAYHDLLIKILKLDSARLQSVADELNISGVLFVDSNGNKYTDIPPTINPIYGFITSNDYVWSQITNKPQLDPRYKKMRLFTNLEIFDLDKMKASLKSIKSNVGNLMQGHIAAMFLKKADLSLSSFIEGFKTLEGPEQVAVLLKFYQDMFSALDYVQMKRGYIHNDVKPDNIVVELGSNTTPPTFQLIDFGLLSKIKNIDKNQPRGGGTPIFMYNTVYQQSTNIFYDWHCILLSVLEMMGYDISQRIYNANATVFDESDQQAFVAAIKKYFVDLLAGQPASQNLDDSVHKLINIMSLNYRMYKYTVSMSPYDNQKPNIQSIMDRFKQAIDA